jgi:hypothetical protein
MELMVEVELVEMDENDFKKKFKVGDVIAGWTGRKMVQITGIGQRCFLYRDYPQDPERFYYFEHKASMRNKWKLLKRLRR